MKDIYQQVGRLHAEGIESGFLSTLGGRFLALLYEALDNSLESKLVLIWRENRIAGFAATTTNLSAVYRKLLSRPFVLLVSLFPSLFNPFKLYRIAEVVLLNRRRGGPSSVLPDAELLSIVVEPAFRGVGVAEEAYMKLIENFQERQVEKFQIVVGEDLKSAHRFYLRMGAKVVGDVSVHGNSRSIIYVQNVPPLVMP